MKILHICETAKGGVGTYINLIHTVTRSTVRNVCVAPAEHRSQLNDDLDVETFSRPKRGLRPLILMLVLSIRMMRRERPDVVFCQSTFSLLVLFILKLFFNRCQLVYCPHGWAQLRYSHRPRFQKLVASIEGFLCGYAHVVVNVCENDLAVALASGYRGRHVVIENALPDSVIDFEHSAFDDSLVNLLFVGRFDRQKGLDVLLEAFTCASMQRDDLVLHVVGAKVDDDVELPSGAFPDRVKFYGWTDPSTINHYYASADLLLMPSRWEGLPMVLIESLRAGTPALVSSCTGLPSLITEGQSGMVANLDAEEIGCKLSALSKDDLRTMRCAARSLYLERYSAPRFKRDLVKLLSLA